MPKGYFSQDDFTAGELSPLVYGRTGGELYSKGCALLKNMVTDSHGPVRTRAGLQYLDSLVGENNVAVMVAQFTANLPYAFYFYDGGAKMYAPEGPEYSAADNAVDNPRFHKGGTGWTVTQTNSDSIISFEKDTVTVITNLDSSILETPMVFTGGFETQELVVHVSNNNKKYLVTVGTTQGGTDVVNTITSESLFATSFSIISGTYWLAIKFDSVGSGTDEGTFKVHLAQVVRGDALAASPIQFNLPYNTVDLDLLRYIETPDGTAIYILHSKYPPHKITYNRATEVWSETTVAFTSTPSEWVAGNYPSVGIVYEGRLWLGATPNEQSTLWGSKSNSYEDFTTGVNDDDAFNFTMRSNEQIMWVLATKDMVVGAASSEIIVTSQGGVLTQSDIQLLTQSSYGSAPHIALLLGDQIIYISPDRRKLRVIQYQFGPDNWISTDLTFPSEHITQGEIIGMAWLQNPGNLLWLTLRDGTMISMTYDRSNDIYGWHKHDTQGTILAGAAGNSVNQSVLFTGIKRNPGFIFVELYTKRYNLDSWDEKSAPSVPVTGFSGFNHLIGNTVHVFTDDADRIDAGGPSELEYFGTYVVEAAGVVSAGKNIYRMVIGLGYTSKFKSLPIDAGALSVGNTGRTHTKRWGKLFLEINESARPLINNKRPPTRTAPTLMNTTEDIKTEKVQVSLLGMDKEAVIEVEQDLPFPLIIISIFGEISQDNL